MPEKALRKNTEAFQGFQRGFLICLLVLIAIVARFLPHPPNFTPVGAVALFCGATFSDRRIGFLVPFVVMVLSDCILGFYWISIAVYASLAINAYLGTRLSRNRSLVQVGTYATLGAVQFFLVTNFACWILYYPHTLAGLSSCYVSAIPFFQNSLLGDILYSSVLFGCFALLEQRSALMRPASSTDCV